MLDQLDFTLWQYVAVLSVAVLGGLVRGFSGFGTALVVTPVLALIVGPRVAIPALTIGMVLPTLQLLPVGWPDVRWREHWALAISGCIGVPIGVALLVWLDPELLRRGISVGTILAALLLMSGWRYAGRPSLTAAAAAGSFGGFLSGAASIGGPPVIAYLLASEGTPTQVRASLIYYFAFTQVAGIALYALSGLLDLRVMVVAAVLTPSLLLGNWLGIRMFALASERVFRMIALGILLAIGFATFVV